MVYQSITFIWQFIELIIDKTITERKVDTIMAILISNGITMIIVYYEKLLNK
jgi:hypothetical protein